jgi:hypothetical protein
MEFEPCDGARLDMDQGLALRFPPMQIGNAVAGELLTTDHAVSLRHADP